MSTSVAGANLYRLQLLDEARTALESRGIPLLYLKGAAFLDTLYPGLDSREMSDVDALVRAEDFERTRDVLESIGYRRQPGTPSVEAFYCWAFVRPGITLEIHRWFCHRDQYDVDYAGVWSRAVVLARNGRTVPTLSPEDTLLQLALHEAKHAFFVDERSAEDADHVIREWRPDWRAVIDRAREWRMSLVLYVSLMHARMQSSAEVPEWVLDELRPDAIKHRFLDLLIDLEGPRRTRFREPTYWARFATTLLVTERAANLTRFLATFTKIKIEDGMTRFRLALEVGPTVAFYQVGLGFVPFTMLARMSARTAPTVSSDRPSPEAIAKAVQAASSVLPGKSTCLGRSLATLALLRRHRFDAVLRLGVARDGAQDVVAHAWVEIDGAAVNERPHDFESIPDLESLIR
jgi:hypothetical protein